MNHTPGPWIVVKECKNTWNITLGRPDRPPIASVTASHPEGKANARLIAAAPDLLNACRVALDVLDEATKRYGFNCSADVRIINKAIAKAEGRE